MQHTNTVSLYVGLYLLLCVVWVHGTVGAFVMCFCVSDYFGFIVCCLRQLVKNHI